MFKYIKNLIFIIKCIFKKIIFELMFFFGYQFIKTKQIINEKA